MNAVCPAQLNQADLEAFERDGFLVVRGVLSEAYIKHCRAITQQWIDYQINEWREQGLITGDFVDEDFRHRFLTAWRAAGEPWYPRSPRGLLPKLDAEGMMKLLMHVALLDLAEQILGTTNIVSHGIFNLRPKAPSQKYTDTPWHQDAQYFRDYAEVNMVNMWFPMHDVDADSSCLAFSPGMHRGDLFENDEGDEQNGFIGLRWEDKQRMQCVPVELKAGDVVLFTNKTPHTAMSNKSDGMRWSWDLRFIDYQDADDWCMEFGSVARHEDASLLTTLAEFKQKWQAADW